MQVAPPVGVIEEAGQPIVSALHDVLRYCLEDDVSFSLAIVSVHASSLRRVVRIIRETVVRCQEEADREIESHMTMENPEFPAADLAAELHHENYDVIPSTLWSGLLVSIYAWFERTARRELRAELGIRPPNRRENSIFAAINMRLRCSSGVDLQEAICKLRDGKGLRDSFAHSTLLTTAGLRAENFEKFMQIVATRPTWFSESWGPIAIMSTDATEDDCRTGIESRGLKEEACVDLIAAAEHVLKHCMRAGTTGSGSLIEK